LYDLGYLNFDEPFKKLVNQGMIQGMSAHLYRLDDSYVDQKDGILKTRGTDIYLTKSIAEKIHSGEIYPEKLHDIIKHQMGDNFFKENEGIFKHDSIFISVFKEGLRFDGKEQLNRTPLNVDISYVGDNNELDVERFKKAKSAYSDAIFINDDDGNYYCGRFPEKMSKSKYNVVNPDDVIAKYGADTFRLFEMFLGPIELSKPWDDKGISGCYNFLRKFWRLFYDNDVKLVTDETPTKEEFKSLHKLLKKLEYDMEQLGFNTSVAAFMICVNELTDLKCHKKAIMQDVVIALAPFAPFVTEELYAALGNTGSVHTATFPTFNESYLVESSFTYPVSVNGKLRATIELPLTMEQAEVQETVMALENVQKWMEGKPVKKFIFVKGKIANVVC